MNELYLVRHGKARLGSPDDERTLSDRGEVDVRRVAQLLSQVGVRPDRVEHSPLVRAWQTATILQEHLGGSLEEANRLRPGLDLETLQLSLLDEPLDRLMLVGHNPSLEQLASLLTTGTHNGPVLALHPGSVAKLVPAGNHRLVCDWLLAPEIHVP